MLPIGIILLQLLLLPAVRPPATHLTCCAAQFVTAPTVALGADNRPANAPKTSSTAPPASTESATIRGVIRAEGQPLPPDIVVYLEPADPARQLPPPGKRVKVSQKAAQFSPAVTVVSVGQEVEFLNDEDRPVEHNVFSNSANSRFDLGLYPQGQSRTVSFDKPGPVVLYCSVHKFMDGVVYVCPAPFFSKVDADGRFHIEGVRPGAYLLKTWQRRKRFPEQTVPVKVEAAGQSVEVNLDLHRK